MKYGLVVFVCISGVDIIIVTSELEVCVGGGGGEGRINKHVLGLTQSKYTHLGNQIPFVLRVWEIKSLVMRLFDFNCP